MYILPFPALLESQYTVPLPTPPQPITIYSKNWQAAMLYKTCNGLIKMLSIMHYFSIQTIQLVISQYFLFGQEIRHELISP